MLTGIDHVVIAVPDLERAVETYARLGFNVHPGGSHPGMGTHNALALFEADYLELLAVRDPAEYRAAAIPRHSPLAGLHELAARGGGFRAIAIASDDLAADVAAMRRRGVDVGDVVAGARRTPAGQELRWELAVLGPRDPLPVFFIQHLTSLAERQRQVPGATDHPNGVRRAERVYVAVENVAGAARHYSRVLGTPEPKVEHGTVIKADMAVFALGRAGLTVAQPAAPGPAAEALARQGPGPFQVLYRTGGMDAAARWMEEHGVPPPARGVRNTGEQAMLVGPEHACGAYIGFVGLA